MAFVIETDKGATVDSGTGNIPLTEEQAQASVDQRNKQAADLGIKTTYRIRK